MKSFRLINLFWVCLLVLACLNHGLFSQTVDEMKKAREFEQQAIQDYRTKNFSGFLSNLQKADELRPNHPRILYNLADAYAVNGQRAESLAVLERISNM